MDHIKKHQIFFEVFCFECNPQNKLHQLQMWRIIAYDWKQRNDLHTWPRPDNLKWICKSDRIFECRRVRLGVGTCEINENLSCNHRCNLKKKLLTGPILIVIIITVIKCEWRYQQVNVLMHASSSMFSAKPRCPLGRRIAVRSVEAKVPNGCTVEPWWFDKGFFDNQFHTDTVEYNQQSSLSLRLWSRTMSWAKNSERSEFIVEVESLKTYLVTTL